MRRRFGKALVLVALIAAAGTLQAGAKEKETYRSVLEQYLKAAGSDEVMATVLDQMISIYKGRLTHVPDNAWDMLKEKVNSTLTANMSELYEPIYEKYLTISDLKQIIKFYESPVGKKMVAATPAMTAEAMTMGEELGERIATEIVEELSQAGYLD